VDADEENYFDKEDDSGGWVSGHSVCNAGGTWVVAALLAPRRASSCCQLLCPGCSFPLPGIDVTFGNASLTAPAGICPPRPCCPGADEEQPSPAGGGRVVLESVSPLPGLLGPLVDYGEDEEDGDTLPLRGGCLFGLGV
jgi:hypothetical protein